MFTTKFAMRLVVSAAGILAATLLALYVSAALGVILAYAVGQVSQWLSGLEESRTPSPAQEGKP